MRTKNVTATSIAEKFVKAINAHDVDGLTKLMSSDHVLVDSLGNKFPASALRCGWQQYLMMVPDYWMEVDQIASHGDVISCVAAPEGHSPRGVGRLDPKTDGRLLRCGEHLSKMGR